MMWTPLALQQPSPCLHLCCLLFLVMFQIQRKPQRHKQRQMKPLGQRWMTTLTSCQSQAHHLYKEQQRGGLRPGWTDLPKGFVLHHVMYMLSVWPGRTGKGQGRRGRQCRLRMMKAL